MLAMQRVISLIFTWCFLLLVSSSQPKVLAVECFSSPISTVVMVSLHHDGKDTKDPTRPRLYKPLFGAIQERHEDSTNHESSAPAVSRKASTQTSAFMMATALSWRGGAVGSPLARFMIPFSYLKRLPAFVAQSKARCAITLCISILGECVSTSLNKYSKVHQSPRALVAAMGIYLMTVMGFNMSLAKIEVGVAYAIWSALGSLVVSTVGIVFFGESCDASKLACLLLIVIGVVGLNLRG